MTVVPHKARQLSLAALGVIAMLSFAACGSDDTSSDSTSSAATPATAAATTAAPAAAATTTAAASDTGTPTLDELTSKGTETAPPSEGPAPAKGKSVYWVSCGLAVPDCSLPAENAKEAAKKLGIDFHIADGKLNVGGGDLTAMRTAMAAQPDAIVVHGIACPVIRAALQEAKTKNIKIMNVEATDCPGEKIYDAEMQYANGAASVQEYFKAWGKNLADILITLTDGKAQILNSHGTYDLVDLENQGFVAELKKCPGCKILDNEEFQQAEQIPNGPYIERVRSAVIKYPQATAVNFGFGSNSASLGGAKIVKDSNKKAIVVSGTGLPSDMDLVRSGLIDAVTAHSSEWMGYGAMDNINRVLNGQPTVPQGIGFRTVTKDVNLPPKAGMSYQTPTDFKAAYDKLWGVTG